MTEIMPGMLCLIMSYCSNRPHTHIVGNLVEQNLLSIRGDPRVDAALGVGDNFADDASVLEVGEGLAGQRAVDLQAIDEHGNGDESV